MELSYRSLKKKKIDDSRGELDLRQKGIKLRHNQIAPVLELRHLFWTTLDRNCASEKYR